MSSKKGAPAPAPAAPVVVTEPELKKIIPIYEQLDNRMHKQALKNITSLLQKHPHSINLKSLKALCLARSDKKEEALALAEEVTATKTANDQVLNTLSIIYREQNLLPKIVDMYEAACAQMPMSEDLHNSLFVAYARTFDFLKQQQVAMKLYKQFGKDQYLVWAICSILAQVPKGEEATHRMAELAEKMLEKAAADGKAAVLGEEGCRLRHQLLSTRGRHEEAARVIASVPPTVGGGAETRLMCAQSLSLAGKIRTAAAVCQSVASSERDQWDAYIGWFDAMLSILAKGASFSEPETAPFAILKDTIEPLSVEASPEPLVAYVRSAIKQIQQGAAESAGAESSNGNGKNRLRGPFLAEIEWEFRVFSHSEASVRALALSYSDLLTIIGRYVARHGSKPVCYQDIAKYLVINSDVTPTDALRMLRDTVAAELAKSGSESSKLPISMECTFAKCARRLGVHYVAIRQSAETPASGETTCTANEQDMLRSLMELYYSPAGTLLSSERHPADDLALCAAFLLMESFAASGNVARGMEAACLLEIAHRRSSHNFLFRLLLQRLVPTVLRSHPHSRAHQSNIELKHIQHESLTYLFLSGDLLTNDLSVNSQGPACSGALSTESEFYRNAMAFHFEAAKEAGDLVLSSLRHLSFSKFQEFLDFMRRLKNSALHDVAFGQGAWVDMCSAETPSEILKKFNEAWKVSPWESVGLPIPADLQKRDNSDREVFSWCEPSENGKLIDLLSPPAVTAPTTPFLRLMAESWAAVLRAILPVSGSAAAAAAAASTSDPLSLAEEKIKGAQTAFEALPNKAALSNWALPLCALSVTVALARLKSAKSPENEAAVLTSLSTFAEAVKAIRPEEPAQANATNTLLHLQIAPTASLCALWTSNLFPSIGQPAAAASSKKKGPAQPELNPEISQQCQVAGRALRDLIAVVGSPSRISAFKAAHAGLSLAKMGPSFLSWSLLPEADKKICSVFLEKTEEGLTDVSRAAEQCAKECTRKLAQLCRD